jgi:hypothetical protein
LPLLITLRIGYIAHFHRLRLPSKPSTQGLHPHSYSEVSDKPCTQFRSLRLGHRCALSSLGSLDGIRGQLQEFVDPKQSKQ